MLLKVGAFCLQKLIHLKHIFSLFVALKCSQIWKKKCIEPNIAADFLTKKVAASIFTQQTF